MRGDASTMKVAVPRSAREAVAAFAKAPGMLPLAGGTDVMVSWNAGLLNGRVVLDLSRVPEWRGVRKLREGLRLGSLVTHAEIQKSPDVLRRFPLLAQACSTIGAAQIQNRGTLGGNIANASPAGDTFPALAVYEALVHAVSSRGSRIIAFSEIFAGVKKTTLGPGELIAAVELHDLQPKPARQVFRKVGTRAAQAISKTVACGLLWLNPDKTVRELRFALGSMAATVRRLTAAEEFVRGKPLDAATIARACELLERDVSPIDDVRSTRNYRMAVSRNIVRQFLEGRPQ
jgi:xanthine dehydrogenase small subunit